MKWTLTKVIRPSDVYQSKLDVKNSINLARVEIVDFRPVIAGDQFITQSYAIWTAATGTLADNPRFIVRPIPPAESWWE